MIEQTLDDLVVDGRITGYTIEEDAAYLEARVPTLTYRMYADGAASHLNLGEFAAEMAELGAAMRLSRVRGNLGDSGAIHRSRQLCLTAEFATSRALDRAVQVVYRRFIAAPAAAPGSWRYPDVRVVGAEPDELSAVFAHHWKMDRSSAVALSADPKPPLAGGRTVPVRILRNWVAFLQGKRELAMSQG